MAEVQHFSIEKATKETLKALALGLEIEKSTVKPVATGLKDILDFYFSTFIRPRVLKKIDNGFSKAGVIFSCDN